MDKKKLTLAICSGLKEPPPFDKAVVDWWWPTNSLNKEHLRLTIEGCVKLSTIIPPHHFAFKFHNSPRQLKMLGKLRIPYYVDYDSITIFSSKVASMVMLYGSFNRYLELIQND